MRRLLGVLLLVTLIEAAPARADIQINYVQAENRYALFGEAEDLGISRFNDTITFSLLDFTGPDYDQISTPFGPCGQVDQTYERVTCDMTPGGALASISITFGYGTVNTSTSVINPMTVDVNGLATIHTGAANDTITNTGTIPAYLYGGPGDDVLVGGTADDDLDGETGDDVLRGGGDTDDLQGGPGDDLLEGGAGVDLKLDGEEGFDIVSYDDGRGTSVTGAVTATFGATLSSADDAAEAANVSNVEGMRGTAQNDTLTLQHTAGGALWGAGGADTLNSGTGNDRLVGGLGIDTLNGNAGSDTASYADRGSGISATIGGANTDSDVYNLIENLEGGTGNDVLAGNGSANELHGGDGADDLAGGGGADLLDGGPGDDGDHLAGNGSKNATPDGAIDRVTYAAEADPVSFTTFPTTGNGEDGDSFYDVQDVTGTALDDTMFGDANANGLDGGAGADTLNGGAGADTLAGGAGADLLHGGGGTEADSLHGNDVLGTPDGAVDLADYSGRSDAIVTSLAGQGAGAGHEDLDVYTDIQGVLGGTGADVLTGDTAANVLIGNAGADVLSGVSASADRLCGGAGTATACGAADASADTAGYGDAAAVTANLQTGANDQGDTYADIASLSGSPGADTLTGDGAANTLSGGESDDTLAGGAGADALAGGGGTDTVTYDDGRGAAVTIDLAAGTNTDSDTYTGVDRFLGSPFDDEFTGGDGADNVEGGGGADTLLGGGGPDTIRGGASNDLVVGGPGADALFGDEGSDDMRANDGEADTVDCGAGAADEARVDGIDTRTGCETEDVTGPQPTVTPNPSSTPSATASPAPTATATPSATPTPKPVRAAARITGTLARARVKKLAVTSLIAGTSVRTTCSSKVKRSCAFRSKTARITKATASLSLVKQFKARKLANGTAITVTVSVPGQIGAYLTLKVVKGKAKLTRGCLAPGSRAKMACTS